MEQIYTQEQVKAFLQMLKLPPQYLDPTKITPSYELLHLLHVHFITTVPFETLDLHYSIDHKIHLSPEALYQKYVADGRGRGGYCLQNNQIFLYMLKALGFEAYMAGAKVKTRVNGLPVGPFIHWVHIVIIVTFPDGTRYMSDVGFGGDAPTAPMLLSEDAAPIHNMGSQYARLTRDFIPGQLSTNPAHKYWHYQYRNSDDAEWISFYVFSDATEWIDIDYKLLNGHTSTSEDSYAVKQVILLKFLREEGEGLPKVKAKRMLVDDVIKENRGAKTEVIDSLKSEDDRIVALKKYFDVTITDEERSGMKGWRSELKA